MPRSVAGRRTGSGGRSASYAGRHVDQSRHINFRVGGHTTVARRMSVSSQALQQAEVGSNLYPVTNSTWSSTYREGAIAAKAALYIVIPCPRFELNTRVEFGPIYLHGGTKVSVSRVPEKAHRAMNPIKIANTWLSRSSFMRNGCLGAATNASIVKICRLHLRKRVLSTLVLLLLSFVTPGRSL